MKQSNNGFTLFELVVALGLMILLLSMVTTIFQAGMTTYREHDRGLSPYAEARDIFLALEEDLQQLIPGSATGDLFLSGDATSLRGIIADRENTALTFLYHYDAATQTFERGTQAVTGALSLPPSNSFTTRDIIGSQVTACTFTYYTGHFSGLMMTTTDTEWDASSPAPIDAPSQMPKAIQVTVSIADENDASIVETFSRLFVIQNRMA